MLNGGFLGIEAIIGLLTGSLALLSDAAHMASDVGALLLAWGASRLAQGLASPGRSYGWLRAETLGAFINALVLLGVCALIAREAVTRLVGEPPLIAALPVLVAGVLGLAINAGSAVALWRSDRGNLGVRAALAHMIADAVGSVGAIASAGFLAEGYPAADPLVSLFLAALVIAGAASLLRDAGRVLLQFAPAGLSAEAVQAALAGLGTVREVHDLHLWTLDGRTAVLSAHVVAAEGQPAAAVRQEARGLLARRFGITHATLQVEEQGECGQTTCALWGPPPHAEHDHDHG